ncbi:MAG: DUF3368 domain-containing protein [Anaerolineae bacterium]
MIVVSDASPLLNLAIIGQLDLLSNDFLLVDERKARRVADRFGLKFTGLMGVLVESKQAGQITAVKPLIDRLRHEANFWISDDLYHYVLAAANETPE